MELSGKQKTIKYVCYCLLIAAAALLQNTPGLFWQIGSARCFLIIPVALIIAMGEEEKAGTLLGLFAGALWDINSASHSGFNCLFFLILCFIISSAISQILRNTFVTNMITTVFAAFLYCLIYWLLFVVIKGIPNAYDTLFTFYIPSAVYTGVISPIIWLAIVPIKRKLNKGKKYA